MRFNLIILAYALVASAQLVDPLSEVICPDSNPANCYPKIFVPTDEWQIVREDQQIPPGLHVRINLETGLEEAKLNEDIPHNNPELMVVPQTDELEEKIHEANEDMKQKIQDTLAKYKKEKNSFVRSKVSQSDLTDFSSSVKELLAFGDGGDISRLEKALDTLTELSHDIEFGVRLSKDADIFAALQRVSSLAFDEEDVGEKAFRIMGSSLRNNPEAIENVIKNQPASFFSDLFEVLQLPSTSDVIQKRILGVIHALSADRQLAYQHLNINDVQHSAGLDTLLGFFPKAGRSAKERIILILEDLDVISENPTSHFDKRSLEMSMKPEYKVSKLLQSVLSEGRAKSEKQFKDHFNTLVSLHSDHKLDISKEFLEWLSEEVELRKLGKRARDAIYSGEDGEFDAMMLEARHVVFGNPNAYRKANDEL